jgi:glycosyltransferase involved in cell wall biosynthesis
MRHCLITTFFGPHSFGGDATYVDHLSRALLRRGEEVMVVYNRDAFEVLKGDRRERPYEPPPGLRVQALQTRHPTVNLLHIHQTGGLGAYGRPIREAMEDFDPDVVHFHNVSLVGGLALLSMKLQARVVRMMTAHEHWLTCPLSLLWKLGRESCTERECLRCMLSAKRPPQLWRSTQRICKVLSGLDRLVFPSESALNEHASRGVTHRKATVLPYFLPEAWMTTAASAERTSSPRPYFLMAGRLIPEKGFQTVIPFMERFPEADLRIVGAGPYGKELRRLSSHLPNVHHLDFAGTPEMIGLYRHAEAVIVPSLFLETFCYVVIEALSVGTPVILRDFGPLPELMGLSHGGLTFGTGEDLAEKMGLLLRDTGYGRSLGESGRLAVESLWSEEAHMKMYGSMVRDCLLEKPTGEVLTAVRRPG